MGAIVHDIKLSVIDSELEASRRLMNLSVSPAGIYYMKKKMPHLTIMIENLKIQPANFLKQEMLARGGDAIISNQAIYLKGTVTNCLVFGTIKQFELLIDKLKHQAFGLKKVAELLTETLRSISERPGTFRIGKIDLDLSLRPYIVGIMNASPDSFYDGGSINTKDEIRKRVSEMEEQGADIIEIGGQSAIPGRPISVQEEMDRAIPVLKQVRKLTKLPISIDTYQSEVAIKALAAGADMVNDITGLIDSNMPRVVADAKCPIVIMHIKGKPKVRQRSPKYRDLMSDVCRYFHERIDLAEQAGIDRDKIIIDPGIGFGKNTEQNLLLTKNLAQFKSLGRPIMYAASHKSFIGDTLGSPVEDRLEGTIAVNTWAMLSGANFIRVHNIREMREARDVAAGIVNCGR